MVGDFFSGDTTAFLDDFTGTVTSLDFETSDYGPQFKFTVKYDTPQPKNDGTLAMEKFFWIGLPDSWNFNGERIVHESGDLGKFLDSRNKFQQIVQTAAEGGARDWLTRDGMNPYMPAAWVGLRAHWMTIGHGQDYNVKDKATGETSKGKTKGYPAPVQYLGPEGGSASNGSSTPAGKQLDLVALGVPDAMLDEWVTLASGHTADEFLRSVSTDIPQLPDSCRQDVVAALSNGSLYEQLHAAV